MTIVSREVLQVKYGRIDDVIRIMSSMQGELHYPFTRMLTDATGPSFNLIMEIEAPDLGERTNAPVWQSGWNSSASSLVRGSSSRGSRRWCLWWSPAAGSSTT